MNVKVLDLSNNKLTFQSISFLLELVEKNKFINKIVFQNIPIKLNLKKTYVQNFKRLNVDFIV